MKSHPLTESQLGMFVAWNADHASTQYAVPVAFALTRDVDLDRLERAVRTVVDAHPVYRTRFVEEEGEVRQVSDPSVEVPILRRKVSVAEAESALDAYPHPYDYFKGPLFRVEILETPEGAWIVFDWAHVIVDGTSGTALFNEVSALYNGADAAETIKPEQVDIFTYAENEKKGFESADYREAAEDAKARFGGRSMTVPEEQVKVRGEGGQGNSPYLEESAVVSRAGIDAWCRANGVHPNLFFMGVFARVLGLYANEKDVVFWTVNHGRKDPALKATRGLMVKTVPVLGELKGELSLADYFKSFKLHKAGVYPFTHFCRDLGIKPGWGFVFQEGTTNYWMTLGTGGFTGRLLAGGGADEMPVLQVFGGPERFQLQMTALPGRYSAAFLKEFAERCAVVAENFVGGGSFFCASLTSGKDSASPLLRDIPVLADGERDEVLELSKGEELEYDRSKTFVDLFAEQAKARPEATAVVDCEGAITYGELDARSDALASKLAELGVKPGGFVGLMLPRTKAFPVAMIAVQKCGAGYVPMDPEYPADRLAYMLENSGAPVLVTTKELFEGKKIGFKGKVVFFDGDRQQSTAVESVNLSTPETPAYMIYTSGSTGRPKGVVLPNRALRAMIAWFVRDCGLGPGKKNLSITSFSFDASVPDLFPPLAAGGELHILTEEQRKDLEGVHDYAVKVGATGLTTSTQLGLALVNTYPELPLEYMMLGGEKMVPFAKTPVRMLNGYGPTEFAVCSSYHEVDQSKSYDIPIGRAVPNSYSLIVDKLGALVPAGTVGELALAGEQIADGYWKLPEKTASVFVDCPALQSTAIDGNRQPSKMYRTGDFARYDENGELEFRGRIDFQVKLRGFRIEIGEIEHAAAAFPGVGAVAAEVKDVAGAKHLVLYYEGWVDANALKAKMAETLTAYMVPDFFVAMDKLPLTPNGKIDRRKLPVPQADDEPIVAPETETEKKVFDVVASVLKTESFGVTHDFNRLGLTSLGAMSLLAKLKKYCNMSLTMKQLTANPTVRQLAAAAGAARSGAEARPSGRRPRRATYPMTENQRGIYADWMRAPEALQYNIPAAFRFTGVAAEKLAAAAEKVIAAHPAFMTRFAEKDGEFVQARRDDFRIKVPVEKVDFEPDEEFLGAALKPFAPDADVLTRGTVYQSPSAAVLLLDIHHTVFDGYSVGIFLSELKRVLDGEEPAGEGYTAFDAALDERDYLESEALDEDDKWFARYLEGAESTSVSTSAEGADGKPGELGRVRTWIPGGTIGARARELGVTASDWFLTAFTELLKRVGREEGVCINFVTAGRSDPEVQETVGMFVKTLPLRGIRDAKTFPEAVKRMHGSVQDLIGRERQSYVRLSEKLGVKPSIIFAFEGGIFDLPKGCELLAPELKFAKAPLSVIVTPGKDDFELVYEYDRSMYSEKDMGLLLGMFAQLSQGGCGPRSNFLTSGKDSPRIAPASQLASLGGYASPLLKDIPLLSAEETARVLALSKGDAIEYDETKTVVNLIHANAIARPFATAVVDCEGSITYGELDARSDALAAKLAELGVKPGGFVGLMLPRRLSFVVSFLAVQKCGAGYVPMDADYPADRLAYMLENSGAPVLITTKALFGGKGLDFKGKVVFFDGDRQQSTAVESAAFNLSTPALPAYMIYTSGSTGRPKGVVIPHRALRHMVAWTVEAFELRPGSRVATHPSFSFDASVIDLFPVLCAGGELHIYGEELRKDLPGMRDYIVKNNIEGGTMSTQIGMTLLDTYPDLPFRYLMVGGEKLMPISKTDVEIFNGYGPTEFTVCSSYQVVDQAKEGDIPIGRAVPGTYSLVVDRYGQLLPQGYAGELALAGPQIAEGYWRLPEKTASVFVDCPGLQSTAVDGNRQLSKMYRTGDLARYNDAGTLDYMGRLDFQVKLRGFRIEIGEIEHQASTYPGVKGVAAEVRDVAGAKHLVLYYGSEKPVDETALKAHMAAALTDYMVPDYFVRMDPLPLTPNGKINRKLLPSPEGASAEAEYVEPATDTEKKIAAVYAEILKLGKFGATTDFFASGGTSLIGIKAVVALQKAGLDVQYGDLFKYKTPRTLAAFLDPSSKVPEFEGLKVDGELSNSQTRKLSNVYADYDYTAIDKLLMATPTELFEGFRKHSLGDVLLTGATGYLGVHVLRYLLESTDATVYALIRPKKGIGPEKRLDSQFVYYFGERVPRRFKERLAFVEGDITDANLGEKLKDLVIGTVFNCAALVKHYVADDLMDRINVGGVENLVTWCGQSGARLIHVSTYSVGGMIRADSGAVLDERHLYVGQESDNDYVRTKFLAERAVLAAIAAGKLRGKIMRLGNLMGREADGEFQMNVGANAFVNSLKSYKALGAYPLENLVGKIEMSPIDRVAEAVCLLATTPDAMCVFHPYNCYPLDMGAVMGAMNRHGFNVDWVSRAEFAVAVDAMRNDPSKASELQGILHYTGHLLKGLRITPAPNDWTTTVLYRLGFRWRPADGEYLASFLRMLDELAVFG